MARTKNASATDSTTSDAAAPRRTRRYTLDRELREFVSAHVLPVFMEQTRKNIDAMQAIASGEADGGVISREGARMMATQFELQMQRAQAAHTQLTEGTLSGSDDASDDASEDA